MSVNPAEAAELCGVTYRRLDYWIRKGYVQVPARHKMKSGVERMLDERTQRVVRALAALTDLGFNPERAAKAAHGDADAIRAIESALEMCWAVDLLREVST